MPASLRALLALLVLMTVGAAGSGSAAAPNVEAPGAGTGPGDARAPLATWQPLDRGDSHWYAIRYEGDGSQIEIRMESEPTGGAAFVVWTPDQIRRWGLGEEVHPIGRGSADPRASGSLLWSGSFNAAGIYYVVVGDAGSQPGASYYLLQVSGDAVSSPTSGPAPATASEPVSSLPQKPVPSEPSGRLVFQTTFGGDLYIVNVDGSGLQRITDGIDPTWSPITPGGGTDDQQIAFTRWREPRGVWVVDSSGSGERRIFDWNEARWPSWSPDGAEIVFSRQYGVVPTGPAPRRPGGPSEGTASSELSAAAAGRPRGPGGSGTTGPGSPTWKLGIVSVQDGSFCEPQPDSDVNLAPDWSPVPQDGVGGDAIVYNGVRGLRLMSIDGKTSFALTSDPKDTSPVWSFDGSRVAYIHRQHDHWEIYTVDVNSGQSTRLTDTPPWPDGTMANSVSPAWSPDGGYLAFLTDRTGEWQIWIMEADGGGARPLFDSELDGLRLEYAFAGERAIDWTW
jgi:Tol biopolymer transport system component